MELSLRPATEGDFAFCEVLCRSNMSRYLTARDIAWEPSRFLASWAEFENLMILLDSQAVGTLRLLPEQAGLGLRDLQVGPEHQRKGLGSWAIRQAQAIAAGRGFTQLYLRVYEENPAAALYARLGFKVESVMAGTVHMVWELPPNQSFKPTLLRNAA